VPADAYPAAVMHLLQVANQDWGVDARARRGRVLATILTLPGVCRG